MRLIWRRAPFEPRPTFPPEVAEFVAITYASAVSILEYGSGGSTLLAASLGRKVVAVESDAVWAARMNDKLGRDHPAVPARVMHVDIGRTGKWGKPVGRRGMPNFHRYPMSVWDAPDFVHPDVILIDGRFRTACFCAAVLRIDRPVRVLFDDYLERPEYHEVERLARPVSRIGRMAVFDLEPVPVPRDEWTWIVGTFFSTD